MTKEKALQEITKEIERCPLCRKGGKGKAVPGEGNPDARIVFIGEAPGAEEAKTGRPFIGRSGKFLRHMIGELGLDDKEVFITSPVHYRPLSGTPSREMVIHGRELLLKQLSIIDPKIVVLLGNTARLALLGSKAALSREQGRVVRKDGRTYLLTVHPAYAIRFPEGKKQFIRDFAELKTLMRNS